jgi:hypothetical protein
VAAGTAGQSTAIHFQDFPAHITCTVWQYFMHFAGPGEVFHVRSQADLRKLPGACGSAKLVLVYLAKLRTAASWAVEMASVADTEANSRPAIFSASNAGNGEDVLISPVPALAPVLTPDLANDQPIRRLREQDSLRCLVVGAPIWTGSA